MDSCSILFRHQFKMIKSYYIIYTLLRQVYWNQPGVHTLVSYSGCLSFAASTEPTVEKVTSPEGKEAQDNADTASKEREALMKGSYSPKTRRMQMRISYAETVGESKRSFTVLGLLSLNTLTSVFIFSISNNAILGRNHTFNFKSNSQFALVRF